MKKIWLGVVKKGKFIPEDRENFRFAFNGFENKEVQVIIQKKVTNRSKNQNSYMWGVVYKLISDYTGQDSNSIHDFMRGQFCFNEVKGHRFPKTTTDLTTEEMEDYLKNIREWASHYLNVYIPLPNEVEY